MRFSKFKRKLIVDNEDVDIGEPIDLIFNESLEITHLIVGGGFIEELLEEIERREDIDIYIPISAIKRITKDLIVLNFNESELTRGKVSVILPANSIIYTKLKVMEIEDIHSNIVGKITDLEFEDLSSPRFIFENEALNEKMRGKGFGQRFEFMVTSASLNIQNDVLSLKSPPLEDIEDVLVNQAKSKNRGKQLIELL